MERMTFSIEHGTRSKPPSLDIVDSIFPAVKKWFCALCLTDITSVCPEPAEVRVATMLQYPPPGHGQLRPSLRPMAQPDI